MKYPLWFDKSFPQPACSYLASNLITDTVYCLLFVMKNFHIFQGLLCNQTSFLVNFCMWILWKFVKAGNHEHFLWNEGKDVEQWKFFTATDKQYTVILTVGYSESARMEICHFKTFEYHIGTNFCEVQNFMDFVGSC